MWVLSPALLLLIGNKNVVVQAGIPNPEKLPRLFLNTEANSAQHEGQGQVHCPCTIIGCTVGIVSTANSHKITCNGNTYTLGCQKPLMGSVGRFFILQTISHPLEVTKSYKMIDQSVWKCSNEDVVPVPVPVPEPVKIGCTECADFNNRIVGGNEATPNKYPFMVQIMMDLVDIEFDIGYEDRYFPMCAGTIINKRYILGAANCQIQYQQVSSALMSLGDQTPTGRQFSREQTPPLVVSVGDHDFCDDDSGQKLIPANIDTLHPSYWPANDVRGTPHDLWMIKLSNDLVWSDTVKPVCLPQDSMESYGGMSAMIMGWGSTEKWELAGAFPVFEPNCILKEGEVKIMDSDDPVCLANTIGWTNQKALTNMCARSDPVGTTSQCVGDAGAPLIINDNGKALMVGVGSYGLGCAPSTGEPDVYVRVTNYLDWIMESTADGTC